MIVNCTFRDIYKKDFTNGPYAFECAFEEVEIGDLVLVETKYGPSLAQVHKISVEIPEHIITLYGELRKVIEICKTEHSLPEIK